MVQAPVQIEKNALKKAPQEGKALSALKEKSKAELFQAISDQNDLHGGWQKNVEERYQGKVEKFIKRGTERKIAEELASKQIQKVWAKVFKDKLATPGTKGSGDFYKNVGDSDGEGAIFLMKKFIFEKKQSFTTYLKHEEIERYAQSSDLRDANVLKIFLDGGGVPGVTVTSNEGKGLRSGWKQSKMVVDHHPYGSTSSSGMVAKMLDIIHLIPAAEKKTVEKFVKTIDIVDSFLSKAGRALDVENDYAKTLCSLSYLLDSTELYKLCEKLPENIGPLSPIPDALLDSIEVIPKGKDTKTKLKECVKKKQVNIDTGVTILQEKLRTKQFVVIEGKKFIVFGPEDKISNDVRAVISAEHDFGTITIFENGDIFMVHDTGIPPTIRELGLTVRDVIFMLNPKNAKHNHIDDLKKFCDALPISEGKKYLLSLLPEKLLSGTTTTISENKSENKKEDDTSKKETAINTDSNTGANSQNTIEGEKKENKKDNITVSKPEQSIVSTTPKPLPRFPLKEIQKDFADFGTTLKGLWSSFIDNFRKKK